MAPILMRAILIIKKRIPSYMLWKRKLLYYYAAICLEREWICIKVGAVKANPRLLSPSFTATHQLLQTLPPCSHNLRLMSQDSMLLLCTDRYGNDICAHNYVSHEYIYQHVYWNYTCPYSPTIQIIAANPFGSCTISRHCPT